MKKRLLTVAATLAVFTLTVVLLLCVGTLKAEAATYSGDCGANGSNVTWVLYTSTGKLTISGSGAMKDYSSYSAPWCSYRSSVKSVTVQSSVTSIGDRAFYGCSSLASIVIPAGVTSIGDGAFYGCSSLTGIVIPDSVTSIGDDAFYGCSSLTSIVIPAGVTSIGGRAFDGCSSLTGIVIPAGVTSIGYRAFYNCNSLTSIVIPDSVTSIGSSAFYGCSSLTSIVIPAGVTSIGSSAFAYCDGLTSIVIPDSVTSIGFFAFDDCSSLTDVYYGGTEEQWNAISIGDYNECLTNATIHFHEHSFGDWTKLDDTRHQRTCECGKIETSDHEWDEGVVTLEPTYATTGIRTYTCLACQATRTETITKPLPEKNGTCGESVYWVLEDDGTLTIWGSGAMANYSTISTMSYAPWYSYRNSIKSVIISSGVTSIGSYAFYNCNSLTSIVIPAGVTSIGGRAFDGCRSLTSIAIPAGVTTIGYDAFDGCSSLTSIVIPAGVTTIGDYAFRGCSSLTSIDIPDSVTSIDYGAFYDCSNLTCIDIPTGVTSIDIYTFCGCSSLTSVAFGENSQLTSIDYGAFYDCINLTSIEIPGGVTTIGDAAFYGCSSLTSIVIPAGVTSIGSYAFSDCSSLTSIEIPAGVTSIGSYAFSDCSSLTSIEIPDSVTTIGDYAFYGCSSLTSIVIPDSVTSIGDYAFYGCSSLTSVHISSIEAWCKISFVSFASNPLYYAHNLYLNGALVTDVVIPDSVTSIGSYAFYNCSSLTSITIPDSVTTIGDRAFYGCSSLTDVYYGGTEEQWNTISIGDYNECLANATIHYTHVFGAWESDGATGHQRVCQCCGATETADHTFDAWSSVDDTQHQRFCTDCGKTEIADHTFDAWSSVDDTQHQRVCTACGQTEIADHTFDAWSSVDDTQHQRVCMTCGEVEVTNHVFSEWDTINGTQHQQVCTACGKTEIADHTFGAWASVDGTQHQRVCATCGKIEISDHMYTWETIDSIRHKGTCSDCGYEMVTNHIFEETWIPYNEDLHYSECVCGKKTFEDHRWDGGAVTTPATHLTEGIFTYTCTDCEGTKTYSIDKLPDHVFGEWQSANETEHIRVCSCGATETGAHSFRAWVAIDGKQHQRVCAMCGFVEVVDHTFGAWKQINSLTHQGTCAICQRVETFVHSFDGEKVYYNDEMHYVPCVCGKKEYEEHLWDDGVETVPPSYTSGGKLTRTCKSCGATKTEDIPPLEKPTPTATIKGASVTLGQALGITYNAEVQNATTTPVMKFTVGEGADAMVTEVEGVYNASNGRYYFELTGVTPQRLGDNILAEVYVNGVLITTKNDYSIKANLVSQLGKSATSETLKTLIYNTLAYGAAAQVVTGHNTDEMINAGYEDKTVAYNMGDTAGADQGFAISNSRNDVKISGVSVNFGDVNKIMVQYVGEGATLYINGQAVEAELINGKYVYYTDGIFASELGKVYTFTLEVDGVIVSTLTYSVNAYAARQQGKTTANAKLAFALFNYGMAAKAYVGA